MTHGASFFKAAAVIALCMIAPSAKASVSDRVFLEVKPAAKFHVVESGGGFQTLLVVTNAPFDVSIAGVVGEVNIDMKTFGHVQGRAFGTDAQTPGVKTDTINVASPFETVIYAGDRATAARQGSLWDQAVQLTVTYDPLADPEISITPQG